MEHITADTIRTYVNKLEQEGYSHDVISRKLKSSLEFVRWAYHKDFLKYSQFQQLKDEIANIAVRFESSDFHRAEEIVSPTKDTTKQFRSILHRVIDRIPLLSEKETPEYTSGDNKNSISSLSPQYYIGMVFVLLIFGILGAGIYERFLASTNKIFAYPPSPSAASRILSFQGRLTDSLGNPITAATNMRFRLYTASSGGTTLYDSGTCSITPDQDGVHNVLIGSDCGSEVASSVFTENTQVWLGVLVGSDSEMTPRQRIANVPYAINAETLQGLPVGTEVSTIPYINAGGDLLMAATSPQIGSTYTNQDFLLSSARAITVQSAGAGDVTLTATESGTIKFATGGSQHGVITNGGLFGFGTTGPDAKLDVLYTGGEQLRLTYADGSTYSSFTTNSGGDLTIDPSGDDLTIGGDLILADTFTVQVGGKTATAYNAFANSSDAPEDGSITSDNDVYIGGDLEVDGNIIGTITASALPWSGLTAPTADLTVAMAAYNTTFTWDPTADATETSFTLNFDGEDSSTDQDQILLALNQTSNGTDVTEAADALLTFTNSDANDPVENAIRFDAGAAGTDFTYGINFDSASIGTAEILLQNAETIGNTVDGTIALGGNADISGTLYAGTADAFQVDAAGNIIAVGATLSGDIAVNGDDITGDSNLTINAASYVRVGDTASPGSANGDDDLFVEGDLEVDGTGYFDGIITQAGGDGSSFAGGVTFNDDVDFTLVGIENINVSGTTSGNNSVDLFSLTLTDQTSTGVQRGIVATKADTTDATTDALLTLDNAETTANLLTDYLIITKAGTGPDTSTDAIDVSDADLGNAINVGANTVVGTTADLDFSNFDVTGSTGNITTAGDIAINGGDITSTSTAFKFDIGNTGTLSFRDGTNTLVAIKDQGVYPFLNLAGKTDTGDPASCAEGDIYYNDTDDTIKICHESNTWEALDGGAVASQWTDSGTTVYLTDTTDEVVIGGSSPLSSAKLSIDGDADQIQLIVQGNATQTTNLATFEQSDGTDVLTITNAGNVTAAGDLAVNGDDITGDSTLTINATSYTRIGDTASPGSANGDDDLFVEGDLEIDGVLYTDGGLDTTFTAGSVVFAGTSGVLAQDNANFFWDDTNNKLGLGDTTPDAKFELSGAATGKALVILNETGDQDIIAASASGTTRFRIANDGTVYGGYFADISNTAYGIDPAGTSNFGGYSLKVTGGALLAADSGNVGIGDLTPDAKLNIQATTEQLRLDYDDSNYTSFTVSSGGDLTLAPTGGDTNITGDLDVSDQFAAGPNGAITANEIVSIDYNTVPVDTSGSIGIDLNQTLTGSGSSSAVHYGLSNTLNESSTSTGNVVHTNFYNYMSNNNASIGANSAWRGVYTYLQNNAASGTINLTDQYMATTQNASTATIGSARNYYSSLINSSTGTYSNIYNFYADTPTNATGTMTTAYGVYVADQSVGTNTTAYGLYVANQSGSSGNAIGLYIADADDYSIQLASTDGDAASGITFGTDTNLYRNSANQLHTDDSFDIDGNLIIDGNTTIGNASGDTVTANADAWTFANDTTVALSGGVNGINFDSNTLSIDATNNRIGIGTAAPSYQLHSAQTISAPSSGNSNVYAIMTNNTASASLAEIAAITGLSSTSYSSGTDDNAYVGVKGVGQSAATGGTTVGVTGVRGLAQMGNANTTTNLYGGRFGISLDYGTVTNAYGVLLDHASLGSTTLTNRYGAYAGNPTGAGSVTNNYGLYVAAQTAGGTQDVGLYIADADTYSLQLASTDGDAASGITFGTDTNLYRNAANTLHTDDNFDIDGTLAVDGNTTLVADLAVNGDDITSDGNLTLNATGYVRVGDTASPGSANGDDDLFVEGDIELDGVLYLDGTIDTTFTAGSVVFAGTSGVLAQDNASFFFDDSANKLGIGDTTPDAFLDITGTTAQLRLSYETGDTNYASFTLSSGGDLTIAPTGSDTNITGNLAVSGNTGLGDASTDIVTVTGKEIINFDTASSDQNGLYLNTSQNTATAGTLRGLNLNANFWATSGTQTGVNGLDFTVQASGNGGTVTTMKGISAWGVVGTGATVSTFKLVDAANPTNSGTVSSLSGFSVDNLTSGTNNTLILAGTSSIPSGNWGIYNTSSYSNYLSGTTGIGTTGPDAKLDVLATTEQLRLTYTDGSVYSSFTTDSGGDLTIDPTGGDVVADANFNPNTDDTYTLGTDTKRWKDLFLGGETLHIGTSTSDEATMGYTTSSNLFNINNSYGDIQLSSGTLVLSGTTTLTASSLTAFNCSDCIDFDDLEDTLDLDAALTLNQSTNTWTQNFTGTTTDGITYNGNSLTSGNLMKMSTTSTSFTSGSFINADWSPGSTTTNSGDLLKINTGTNGNLTGNYINLLKGSSTLFKVAGGNGNVTTEGDLAINGGDITSSAALNIDVNTNITTPDTLTVGSATAGVGKLNVTGAQTGKALTILNETGDQNVLVASISGTQAFAVTNNGDVVQGKNGGISGLADNESLAPNPSFEIDADGVYPPDGWTDSVGTNTTTSSSNHGNTAILFDTDTDAIISHCFPIAGGKNLAQGLGTDRTYTVSLWSQLVNAVANNGLNAGIYTYTSRSNCTSNTTPTKRAAFANSSPTIIWGYTSGTVTPPAGDTWARAYVIYDYSNNDADMRVDGVIVAQTNVTSGLDLAETYPADSADNIQIGEIVSFGVGERQNDADVNNIKRSNDQYDKNAFGVVATQPGYVLDDNKTYTKVKVALKGRVPVLVTTENGPIKIGDPITASSKPGVGMKATKSGRIIGYAMSEWTSTNPQEVDQVTVFVNPETYVDLSILTSLQESVAKLPALTASALSRADDIIINSADALLIKTEKLVAQSITVANATIDNLIVDRIVTRDVTAKKIQTDTLTAQKVTTDSIATQDLAAKDATFSGKLVAQEIDADNIRELRDRLEKLAAENDAEPTIDSSQLQSEVEDIQQYLEQLPEKTSTQSLPLNEIATNTTIDPGTTTSISGDQISMMNLEQLTVTGESAMTSLVVADSFSAGNIFIKDNSILSLSNELKLSALEQISLMDGAVIIAKNGTITAKGEVIAEKGIRTNTIKPIDGSSSVGVQLSQNKVEVLNNDNVVAAIDTNGSAKFKDVSVDTYTDATSSAAIIASADNYEENGIFSPGIQTNAAAAGNGILPAQNDTVVIFNDKVGPNTLVYVTATSKTYNNNLYIEDKKSCTEQEKLEENCKPYFTVHIDAVLKDPITFNWWIVN